MHPSGVARIPDLTKIGLEDSRACAFANIAIAAPVGESEVLHRSFISLETECRAREYSGVPTICQVNYHVTGTISCAMTSAAGRW